MRHTCAVSQAHNGMLSPPAALLLYLALSLPKGDNTGLPGHLPGLRLHPPHLGPRPLLLEAVRCEGKALPSDRTVPKPCQSSETWPCQHILGPLSPQKGKAVALPPVSHAPTHRRLGDPEAATPLAPTVCDQHRGESRARSSVWGWGQKPRETPILAAAV